MPVLESNFRDLEGKAVMKERSPTGSSLGSILSAFVGSW